MLFFIKKGVKFSLRFEKKADTNQNIDQNRRNCYAFGNDLLKYWEAGSVSRDYKRSPLMLNNPTFPKKKFPPETGNL